MSAKISASRRAAYLKALEASGNATLAAERAKVSRSWALAQRKLDPEFDAACVKAKKQSFDPSTSSGQAKLRSTKPPSGWGHLDGVELVVRGSGGGSGPGGGRRVQIARARLHQWTPRVEERFLAALMATCNVKAAYEAVGMSKGSAYTHRRRRPEFAARWQEAIEIGYEMLDRALMESAFNTFARAHEIEPDAPIEPMTVAEVIRYLGLHRHAVKGVGKRPGRMRSPDAEVRRVVRSLARS